MTTEPIIFKQKSSVIGIRVTATEYNFLQGIALIHKNEEKTSGGENFQLGSVGELIRFGFRAYVLAYVKRMKELNLETQLTQKPPVEYEYDEIVDDIDKTGKFQ